MNKRLLFGLTAILITVSVVMAGCKVRLLPGRCQWLACRRVTWK